jgi:GNAT superfamily N-acetyltransferase
MAGWAPPDSAALTQALAEGWRPAESARIGGWLVRWSSEGGKRASAIWPFGDPGMDLDAAVAAASGLQRSHGARPLAHVGPADGPLDARLAALGWDVADPCHVLAAPAAAVAARGHGGRMAVAVRCPLAALDELWEAGGIGPGRRAVMETTPAPKEIVLMREDDRAAAALFVAATGPVATLHAVHVAPAFRRRGVGAALCAAAGAWALEAGAETLALAVTVANAPARALYGALGFVEAFPYHYRRAPEAA